MQRRGPALLLLFSLLTGAATAGTVVINEMVSSNGSIVADEDGDFEDWIEIYNTDNDAIQLGGYTLTDDIDTPRRWEFPPVHLEAGGHLLVWASGKDRSEPGFPLHTNFSISREGEPILLSSPSGELVDIFPATPLPRDASLGRSPDGTGPLRFFSTPTPGAPNTTTTYTRVLPPPTFSHPGGFHEEPFHLELFHPDEDVQIVYTVDGSLPSIDNLDGVTYPYKLSYPRNPGNPFGDLLEGSYRSLPYDAPLPIVDRSEEPDSLTGITTTWDRSSSAYAPRTPVFKGTVVRARAYAEDALPSEIITRTFFVTPEGAARYSLPVLSLAIQEDHLFDYENGIHVAGIDFDNWRTNSPESAIRFSAPANYHRRGRDWEYPTHLEYYHGDGDAAFSQNLGWRIHGGGTRARAQKSLRLYARNAYDPPGTMEFPFFPGHANRIDGAPIESFHRLILRNSGDDLLHTRMRDAFLHRLLRPLEVDHQAYSPTVKFINGEYWGLINIRERLDRYYIAANHLVDPDDVVMLVNNAEISEGTEDDRQDWLDLIAYCGEHDLSIPEHYAHVADRIDIENFILYQMGQIYIKNVDWPGNNNRYWRTRTPHRDPGFPPSHDGRWRWILFDLDFGFGRLASWEPAANHAVSLDTLSMAAAEEQERQNPPWSTALFRALLDNEEFRQRFIIAMADHINTTFDPPRVERLVDEMHAVISPYLEEHRHRWRNTMNTSPEFLKTFGELRPDWVRQHVVDFFDLEGTHEVHLQVGTPEGGTIRVNTVEVPHSETGWNGVYFLGIPLRVEAVPHQGYTFSGWEGSASSTGRILEFLPDSDVSLSGAFTRVGDPEVLHYWNFNDSTDFLEPTHTMGGGAFAVHPDEETSITTGTGNGFAGENSRLSSPTGSHLRINHPIGSEIHAHLPTTNARDIRVTYETRRSGQGAGLQTIHYSLDGTTFHLFDHRMVHATDPAVQVLNFREVVGADNNPDFALRITFDQAMGGRAGNNRFDNFLVEGVLIDAPSHDDLDLWLLN